MVERFLDEQVRILAAPFSLEELFPEAEAVEEGHDDFVSASAKTHLVQKINLQLQVEKKQFFSTSARRVIVDQITDLERTNAKRPASELADLPATLSSGSAADRSKYAKTYHKAKQAQQQLDQAAIDLQHLQALAAIMAPVVSASTHLVGYPELAKKGVAVWETAIKQTRLG
eukprot:m.6713 g.6713  ORF g.6713 m.6713 type:complete len:172 (+) comp2123_c0_seq1:7-522(+)